VYSTANQTSCRHQCSAPTPLCGVGNMIARKSGCR